METKQKLSKEPKTSKRCTLGWNWGFYDLDDSKFTFRVNNQECFHIPYQHISIATANGKNEVTVEINKDEKTATRSDILTECRFFVPNPDLDEEEKAEKDGVKETDEIDIEEIGKTPAQIVTNRIIKKAGIGEFSGDIITSIPECPMLIPRGKYSLEIYETFVKFHGRTHDYKILFKDINRSFLLPKPDSYHLIYIIALNNPIRQGQTTHNYLAMQIQKDSEVAIQVNLSQEEINKRYQGVEQEMKGNLYDIIAKIFKMILGISIIVPSGFSSAEDKEGVKCNVKANEGYLYPLKKSLLWIHKPVSYIRHSDIQHCEFARVSEFASHSSRSFDCTIVTHNGDTITFSGIDTQEYKPISAYFASKKLKVKKIDDGEEENQELAGELEEDSNDEDDEDFVVGDEKEESLPSDDDLVDESD
ncbi:unnamed protein product [Moneuplotes crassus]|uniref:FACT complex subunit SSRP1 n=1 Tax=Euplotes crassus TaxID=5936 RepID=A0AAD1XEE8_EUPCR|nr:unnamed protein product [Moneuplotes crassus]